MNYTKGKIICIGDIHGELYKLQKLFNKISIGEDDTIIFLGDYIDRGQYSKQVIDYIMDLKTKHNVITLEGNHEQMARSAYKGSIQFYMDWCRNGGETTFKSYKEHEYPLEVMFEGYQKDFFDNLKLCHEEENFIFAHGYIDGDLDCCDQNRWPCLWYRFDDIQPHKSGKTVVVGHTIQRGGITNKGYKICIDTGSFLRDGFLTAMVIDGGKVGYINSEN